MRIALKVLLVLARVVKFFFQGVVVSTMRTRAQSHSERAGSGCGNNGNFTTCFFGGRVAFLDFYFPMLVHTVFLHFDFLNNFVLLPGWKKVGWGSLRKIRMLKFSLAFKICFWCLIF